LFSSAKLDNLSATRNHYYKEKLLEVYIEKESIISLQEREARHEVIVQRALEEFAKNFGTDVNSTPETSIFRQAVDVLSSPPPFPGALSM